MALPELAEAKWGWVARRLTPLRGDLRLGPAAAAAGLGQFAVASVVRVGEHNCLEDPHGRRLQLYPDDLVVGAFGNRYATDFYEGYLPTEQDKLHLLTSGGLLGTVASGHRSRANPTELRLVGQLVDGSGRALRTDDVAIRPIESAPPALGTIVVLGTSMNSGKTTTTAAIVHGLTRAGATVGAGKVTGSASGKDHWSYLDAGAVSVLDFVDAGMPSTFGYPVDRLAEAMGTIRAGLVNDGATAVVLEIADGVLQRETYSLAARLPGFADTVVLTVGDALGAIAGVRLLAELGVTVRAISGLVTASPLATREAEAATGLPVLSPSKLINGAAENLVREAPTATCFTPVSTSQPERSPI
ncbi:MAG TPA: DUF1611 domain-containing protein [Pseudonocardia sp.]|jgi:hypothetical protein